MVSAPTFDCLYEKLVKREKEVVLIDLGYVGMPIAVEFAKHVKGLGLITTKSASSSTRAV